MSERDDRLERTYRSIAREEPPASLDAAILAAAHRAAARPSAARRWGVPVSIAAVVMLAVGVTLEMQHEKPGIEVSAPANESAPAAAPPAPEVKREESPAIATGKKRAAAAPELKTRPVPEPASPPKAMQEKPEAAIASPRAESRRKDATPREPAPEALAPEAPAREAPQAFPAAPAPAQANLAPQAARIRAAPRPPAATSTPAPAEGSFAAPSAQRLESPAASVAKRSAAAGASADLMAAPVEPVRELERIAKLREEGRHAEADRALEEFRKRFPAYRIDDAMWQRVKPP